MAPTYHGDASVDTDLWQINVVGVMSDHPVDGESIFYWDDPEHGAIVAADSGLTKPVWKQASPPMLLPCADFASANLELRANDGVTGKTLADMISNSAFTWVAAIRVDGVTSNAATVYQNEAIIADASVFWGVFLRNTGSGYEIRFYNYDGNADEIVFAISLNTTYIVMVRHESGALYASIDGGSESMVASGNTSDLTHVVNLGWNAAYDLYFNGQIGEHELYNTAVTGGTLAALIAAYRLKWQGVTGSTNARQLTTLGVG